MNNGRLPPKPRYPILDGLRGVAALIVIAFHIFEANSTNHFNQIINHGYLAVDFFFLLSGFVIGYAYDDRWHKLTIGGFFKRRIERLQPMAIMGMVIGAVCFYASDSVRWPLIHTIPLWRMLMVMCIGSMLIPIRPSMDIRGWGEMFPLNAPAWSLFYEYVANVLYALVVRKFSKTVLWILVIILGVILVQYAVTSPSGDMTGGWAVNTKQIRTGLTRMLFPFFAGLLLSRIAKPSGFKNTFSWCSILLIIILFMPRIGGTQNLWMNGLYEALSIIFVFPLIVYLGAGGNIQSKAGTHICNFLGDISYPIYIIHYPLIYVYNGWVSNHPNISLLHALPYALFTYFLAIALAYASLKFYDEPVRKWLRVKLK